MMRGGGGGTNLVSRVSRGHGPRNCWYPLVACARRRALVLRTRRKNWTPLETVGVEIVSGAFVVLRDGRICGETRVWLERRALGACDGGVDRAGMPVLSHRATTARHLARFACRGARPRAVETTQIRVQRCFSPALREQFRRGILNLVLSAVVSCLRRR